MSGQSKKDRGPSPAELSGFCAEVALMLGSGMALYDGMEALSASRLSGENANMYAALSEAVTRTGSLYEALKEDARWPKYLTEMAGIGERTGRLEEVMQRLSEYYERESRIRGAIVSAVTYPLVLGVMMLLIVLIMILKVLPVFRRVLGSMGVAMTSSGNLMMSIGVNTGWAVLTVVGLVVLAALVCVGLTRTRMRSRVIGLLRGLFPPIRRVSGKLAASRMASVISMMLSGGFPLEEALELLPDVLPDETAAGKIGELRAKMADGVAFADALEQSGMFDGVHTRMIRMAIAAGREDQVMEKVAAIYEEQVEESIAGLVAIIEPTLVALLSVVIGAILLSLMLPMAGIISSMI